MAIEKFVLIDTSEAKVNIYYEKISSKKVGFIAFSGSVDKEDAYKLNRETHRLLPTLKMDLILDLSELKFINSVGVAVLFSIFHYQQQNNYQVCIGGMHPFLQDVFDLVYLPPEVIICESVEQAKQKLS